MKAIDINPYDTVQVAKARKRYAAFLRAKRTIAGWPKWKQDVGYPPMSNVRGKK